MDKHAEAMELIEKGFSDWKKSGRDQIDVAGEHAVVLELVDNGFTIERVGGDSEDVDFLCRENGTDHALNIKVVTLGPDTDCSGKNLCFKFCLTKRDDCKDKCENLIKTISTKRIYYVFCALANPDFKGREKTRFFVATPEQVIAKIKARARRKSESVDFILFEEPHEPKDDYGVISFYENRWDLLKMTGYDKMLEDSEKIGIGEGFKFRQCHSGHTLGDNGFLRKLDPEKVVFFRHYSDISWDHDSEDTGHYYEVVYMEDGELKSHNDNPEGPEVIFDFLVRAQGFLVERPANFYCEYWYYNRDAIKDIWWENDELIYKEKYRRKLKERVL